jgi:saccharopine dehydrogenase-like NADP-dependent oxidoreductase
MGRVAIKDLLASPMIDEVKVGDIELRRAKRVVEELKSKKLSAAEADATDSKKLVQKIRGCQVLLNATWYEYNLSAMKAALEAGVHYVDLGGLFHMTRKQLKLDLQFKRAGLTAILGAGESPGITNMMCKSLTGRLDSVDVVRIRVGGREVPKSNKLVFPFAIPTIFDEYAKRPVVYRNGEFRELEPLSGNEEVRFPQPVGKNTCHYCLHSEIATLPKSFRGVKLVDFKLGISERIYGAIKPLLAAGLSDTRPVTLNGKFVSPHDFAIAYLSSKSSDEEPTRYVALRTEVRGQKRGRENLSVSEMVGAPSKEKGVRNATGLLTGLGASVVTQMILADEARKTGVMSPETCLDVERYFDELERKGIRRRIVQG